MIIDTLNNLKSYASLNSLFPEAIRFLEEHNMQDIPLGKIELQADSLYINVVQAMPKNNVEAKLETHDRMIDIQIPISGAEIMGYSPRVDLIQTSYDTSDDISFYPNPPLEYITVKPGMFVIFFPQDGHAPAITPTPLKKIIIKVKA